MTSKRTGDPTGNTVINTVDIAIDASDTPGIRVTVLLKDGEWAPSLEVTTLTGSYIIGPHATAALRRVLANLNVS